MANHHPILLGKRSVLLCHCFEIVLLFTNAMAKFAVASLFPPIIKK